MSVSCTDVSEQQTTVDVAEREIEVDTIDFPKHVEVLGLHVYATAAASDEEVLHAAAVLAEYLDNDEDGTPDNQKIVDAMIQANATLVVGKNGPDLRAHDRPWPNSQGVYTDEIFPLGQDDRYDGALEEVLHLITDYGWENAYPSVFGRWRGTEVAKASEAARGGYFEEVPEKYPEGAWHTYYAESCDYGCHIAEYIHWALTSILGAHERYWKELGGKDQWDLRSKEKVKAGDPTIYALLTDPQYKLPTVLPDGKYRGKELRIQHDDDEESTIGKGDPDTTGFTKSENSDANIFTKQIEVFGIHIYATDMVSDKKMLHTADVLAQYLDNDEDGTPDNQKVVDEIVKRGGGVFMTEYEGKYEWDELRKYLPPGPKASVYDDQTYPDALVNGVFNRPREEVLKGALNAPWEEVLHLITRQGYAHAYPSVFGYTAGSELADAMDLARGGHFPDRRPEKYPDGAWFTYYDNYSCSYDCMISEYVYWALTSILGAQAVPGRAESIKDEWKLPTKEQVRTGDPAVYELLTNPKYKLPTVLPDAEYRAKTFIIKEYR
jgi:hypothetical protein